MSEEIKIFNLQGQVEGISSRKDGSVVVKIATQEVKPTEAGYLMMMNNKHVYFFMAEKAFQANELNIPDEPKLPERKISASQKLRFELFDLFRSRGKKEEELEQCYQDEMLKIVNHYKTKRKK